MKKFVLSAVLFLSLGASAAQVVIGDAELSSKAATYLNSVFKTDPLPELKIYNCHGIKNQLGEFGTCVFHFAAEGTALDNTYIYLLRQDGKQDFLWVGHTNRQETF